MAMRSLQVHPDLAKYKRTYGHKEYARIVHLINNEGKTDNQAFAQMLIENEYATQEQVGAYL